MLPAISFYTFLFLALLALPAAMILAVLVFFEYERRRLQEPGQGWLARMLAQRRVPARFAARFPRTALFLAHRLNPHAPWGLPATLATVVIVAGTWLFLGVLEDIASKDPLVVLDLRLHNSVSLLRTERMTRIMLAVTELGGAAMMGLLCAGAALRSLAQGRRRLAVTWVLALAGIALVTAGLKALFGFQRPIEAIVSAQQGSFPSGHMLSATVVYGLLAALLLGRRGSKPARATGVTLLLLTIVGVGLSRLYLGVHWPSDLLGSMALALVVLALLLFFLHYTGPVRWIDTFRIPPWSRAMVIAGNSALVLALPAAALLSTRARLIPVEPPAASVPVGLGDLLASLPRALPRWSEDLVGGRMEPISLVLVGSRDQIEAGFIRAGWRHGDLPTPVRVVQEAIAAVRNMPDPTGPATPAFVMDRPQGVTYEKQDQSAPSIRRRHHTRLWQTQYCLAPACRPIWVATASFDVGLRLSEGMFLPTHRIDPALDAERALIAADLAAAGATLEGSVTVSPPVRGKNAAGDPFWTDGTAAVLAMP